MALALLLTAGTSAQPARQTPIDWEFEFPDSSLASSLKEDLRSRRVEEKLDAGQPDADVIAFLLPRERMAEAMRSLPIVLAGPTAEIVGALDALTRNSSFWSDDTHDYATPVRQAIEPLRARLRSLPREDAARITRALIPVDDALADGRLDRRLRAVDLIRSYPGTHAAELTVVDLILQDENAARRAMALEQYSREHPGTEPSAEASYWRGKASGNLLEVMAIIQDLTSGRYPECEWVSNAYELANEYLARYPTSAMTAARNEGFRAAYEIARTHFDRTRGTREQSGLDSFITHALVDLSINGGDRATATEDVLARLEADVPNKAFVRLLRARLYLEQPAPLGISEAAMKAFRGVADEDAGLPSRQALAILADRFVHQGRHAEALPLLREYVGRYPASPWAWVAAIQIGQCEEALGDLSAAGESYELAAGRYASSGPAVLIASALAGRTYDKRALFQQGFTAYSRALQRWEAGDRPGNFSLVGPPWRVDGRALADRVTQLERRLASSTGALLEQASLLMSDYKFDEAARTALDLLRRFPNSPDRAAANTLLRSAQLKMALRLASPLNPRGHAGARAAFDELAGEPFDFTTAAAALGRAIFLATQGAVFETQRADIQSALTRLAAGRAAAASRARATALETDVASIQSLLTRRGSLPLADGRQWEPCGQRVESAFTVANAELQIKRADGQTETAVLKGPSTAASLLLLTGEELALLADVLETFQPSSGRPSLLGSPPPSTSLNVRDLLEPIIDVRPGFYSWEAQSCPSVLEIEFLDDARARAVVTVGTSGSATSFVTAEKVRDVWRLSRLSNRVVVY